jgi:hypothetical protein
MDATRKRNLCGAHGKTVGKGPAEGKCFPFTTHRLPDCPYETDTFFFISQVGKGAAGTNAAYVKALGKATDSGFFLGMSDTWLETKEGGK